MNISKAIRHGAPWVKRKRPVYKNPMRTTMARHFASGFKEHRPVLFIGNVWVIP